MVVPNKLHYHSEHGTFLCQSALPNQSLMNNSDQRRDTGLPRQSVAELGLAHRPSAPGLVLWALNTLLSVLVC